MTNEKLLAFVQHIASFRTFHECLPEDAPKDAVSKEYEWLVNDSEDLETIVLEARKLIQEVTQ